MISVTGSETPSNSSNSSNPPAEVTRVDIEAPAAMRLRKIRDLLARQELNEAEAELLLARADDPRDPRLIKLLALVHFKQGRLAEAYQVYREAIAANPNDPTLRLNLGLVALKLERFAEAVVELEMTLRLNPEDQRAYSYLGLAYARLDNFVPAAVAFRRAGQIELAEEMERKSVHVSGEIPVVYEEPSAHETDQPKATQPTKELKTEFATEPGPIEPIAELGSMSKGTGEPLLSEFVMQRVVSMPAMTTATAPLEGGGLRFSVTAGCHVRESSLWVALGGTEMRVARRRIRGKLKDEHVTATGDRFIQMEGKGELLLMPPSREHHLVCVALNHDVFFLDEARAMAWSDSLVFEAGRLPGRGHALLQFRGEGLLVFSCGIHELAAVRIGEGDSFTIPLPRLVGWVGHVVVHGESLSKSQGNRFCYVTCEGEGMLLLSRHVESK